MESLSHRDRRLVVVVPIVLVSVALGQLLLGTLGDLSPWKGGGFGMFASADHVDTRVVRVTLETPGESLPLRMTSLFGVRGDPELVHDFLRVRAHPTAGNAVAWAARIAHFVWELEDAAAVVDPGAGADPGAAPPTIRLRASPTGELPVDGATRAVARIAVWGTAYDRPAGEVRPRLVAEHRVPVTVDPAGD